MNVTSVRIIVAAVDDKAEEAIQFCSIIDGKSLERIFEHSHYEIEDAVKKLSKFILLKTGEYLTELGGDEETKKWLSGISLKGLEHFPEM